MDKKQIVIESVRSFLKKVGLAIDNAVLFGSYANGGYREDSDIDLIVVSEDFEGQKMHKRGKDLYNSWFKDYDYDVDFVCLTPDEFEEEKKKVGIVSEALRGGVIVL